MSKHPRTQGAYSAHAFSRLTPRENRIQNDSGDWICKLEYPDVGREAPCPRCNQPTRWLNTVTVSPEGSGVRYFTICSPLCRCPDDQIREQIARIVAEIVVKEWRNRWLKAGDRGKSEELKK